MVTIRSYCCRCPFFLFLPVFTEAALGVTFTWPFWADGFWAGFAAPLAPGATFWPAAGAFWPEAPFWFTWPTPSAGLLRAYSPRDKISVSRIIWWILSKIINSRMDVEYYRVDDAWNVGIFFFIFFISFYLHLKILLIQTDELLIAVISYSKFYLKFINIIIILIFIFLLYFWKYIVIVLAKKFDLSHIIFNAVFRIIII